MTISKKIFVLRSLSIVRALIHVYLRLPRAWLKGGFHFFFRFCFMSILFAIVSHPPQTCTPRPECTLWVWPSQIHNWFEYFWDEYWFGFSSRWSSNRLNINRYDFVFVDVIVQGISVFRGQWWRKILSIEKQMVLSRYRVGRDGNL